MAVVRFPRSARAQKRAAGDKAVAPPRDAGGAGPYKRKLIEFDAETWHALHLLSRDSLKSVQELADEAFVDLLHKHGRPTTLKEALRESARRHPANDPRDSGPPSKGTGGARAPKRRR
jgi:hypothetical protein